MADKLLKFLAKNQRLRNASPAWMRKTARKILPVSRYNKYLWAEENPHIGTDNEFSFKGHTKNKLGIIFDPAQYLWRAPAGSLAPNERSIRVLHNV